MLKSYNHWLGRDPRDFYNPNSPYARRTTNNLRSMMAHKHLYSENNANVIPRNVINNTKRHLSNEQIERAFFPEDYLNYGNKLGPLSTAAMQQQRTRMKSRKNRNKVTELENMSMRRISPAEYKKHFNNLQRNYFRHVARSMPTASRLSDKPGGLTNLTRRHANRERRMVATRRAIKYPDPELNSPELIAAEEAIFRSDPPRY